MNGSGHGEWRIGVSGVFDVQRPDGAQVQFSAHKAAAMFALLALVPGQSMPRSALAASLWPGAAPSLAGPRLRQVLRRARISLGEGSPLRASRARVWLEPGRVRVKPHDPSEPFLPEFEEPCFAPFRPAHERPEARRAEAVARQSSASRGVLSVLGWTARYRPAAGLEIARLAPELLESAAPRDLREVADDLIRISDRADPHLGWALAFRAIATAYEESLRAALPGFELAEAHARRTKAVELSVFSGFYRIGCLIVAGRVQEAARAWRGDGSIARAPLSPDLTTRRAHGDGLTLIHSGATRAGLAAMWAASEQSPVGASPFELGYLRANLAWFEATVGDPRRAERALEGLRSTGADDCVRLEVTARLAESGAALRLGDPRRAARIAQHAEEISLDFHLGGMTVYTAELTALALLAQGDRPGAARARQTAAERRTRHGFGRTRWDDLRLAPLDALGA